MTGACGPYNLGGSATLEAKRECLDVEVVEWPRAGGERSSSSGCRDERLLTEAEHAELVGDEV